MREPRISCPKIVLTCHDKIVAKRGLTMSCYDIPTLSSTERCQWEAQSFSSIFNLTKKSIFVDSYTRTSTLQIMHLTPLIDCNPVSYSNCSSFQNWSHSQPRQWQSFSSDVSIHVSFWSNVIYMMEMPGFFLNAFSFTAVLCPIGMQTTSDSPYLQ